MNRLHDTFRNNCWDIYRVVAVMTIVDIPLYFLLKWGLSGTDNAVLGIGISVLAYIGYTDTKKALTEVFEENTDNSFIVSGLRSLQLRLKAHYIILVMIGIITFLICTAVDAVFTSPVKVFSCDIFSLLIVAVTYAGYKSICRPMAILERKLKELPEEKKEIG